MFLVTVAACAAGCSSDPEIRAQQWQAWRNAMNQYQQNEQHYMRQNEQMWQQQRQAETDRKIDEMHYWQQQQRMQEQQRQWRY